MSSVKKKVNKKTEIDKKNSPKKNKNEENVKLEDNLNENGEKKSKNEISQNGETPEKFWLNNINSGNVYRSFIKGNNPWFKSSAFTQKLPYTKGAFQYYQNAIDNPYGKGYQYNFKKETVEKKENKEEKVLEDFNPKDQYFSMNYLVYFLDYCYLYIC